MSEEVIDAVMQFIAVVETHFPAPRFGDDPVKEAAWFASMNRSLRGYGSEVLLAAAQDIVRSRTAKDGRGFPLPAECTAACDRAARLVGASKTPLLAAAAHSGQSEFSPDRHALALDLCKSSLGQQAAREGWLGPVYAFAVRKARLPAGPEIETCRQTALGFAEALDACERGEAGTFSGPLARLGRSIARHRDELRAKLVGGQGSA